MHKIKTTQKTKSSISMLDIIRHDVNVSYLLTVKKMSEKTGLSTEFCSKLVMHDMRKRLPGIPAEGQKI